MLKSKKNMLDQVTPQSLFDPSIIRQNPSWSERDAGEKLIEAPLACPSTTKNLDEEYFFEMIYLTVGLRRQGGNTSSPL